MYNGKDIFKLVDTHGLPLEIIVLELRDKKQHFNAVEFIQAAKKAGWKAQRVWWMMKTTLNDEKGLKILKENIDKIYENTNN